MRCSIRNFHRVFIQNQFDNCANTSSPTDHLLSRLLIKLVILSHFYASKDDPAYPNASPLSFVTILEPSIFVPMFFH